MDAAAEPLAAALAAYHLLCDEPSPEDEPHRSLYAGRRHLEATLPQCGAGGEGSVSPASLLRSAVLRAKLGCNFAAAEETGDAERCLQAALTVTNPAVASVAEMRAIACAADGDDDVTLPLYVAAAHVEGLNTLATLYAGWDRGDEAAATLALGRRAYSVAVAWQNGRGSLPPTAVVARAQLDAAFTLTLFYLAQLHSAAGRTRTGAVLIEATLLRQLAAQAWWRGDGGGDPGRLRDAVEWQRDARSLAVSGRRTRRWGYAAQCLAAADAVLARLVAAGATGDAPPPPAPTSLPDTLQHSLAEAAAQWGFLYLDMLAHAAQRAEAGGTAAPIEAADAGAEAEDGDGGVGGEGDGDAEGAASGRAGPPPLHPDATVPATACHWELRLLLDSDSDAPPPPSSASPFGAALVALAAEAPPQALPSWFVHYGPATLLVGGAGGEGCSAAAVVAGVGECGSRLEVLPVGVASSRADAVKLFAAADRAFARALRYYTLEGFVTRHAELRLELARLYEHVSAGWGGVGGSGVGGWGTGCPLCA